MEGDYIYVFGRIVKREMIQEFYLDNKRRAIMVENIRHIKLIQKRFASSLRKMPASEKLKLKQIRTHRHPLR